MRIAMFLKDENLKRINVESIRVLIFTMSADLATGMEEHKLYNKNLNYISVWLLDKKVDTIFVREADEDVIEFFRKMDISVKTSEDIENNQFLKAFLI